MYLMRTQGVFLSFNKNYSMEMEFVDEIGMLIIVSKD